MSNTGDLLAGLAGDLVAAGVGITASSTPFASMDTGIVYSRMPQTPDRVVVLSAYKIGGDSPAYPSGQVNVQVRTRGNPNDPGDADTLDDAVYDVIQGLKDRLYGSVHVTQALVKSSLPLGMDGNNRYERSTNYVLDVDLPATTNRTY